ncbi:MAG: NAD(P)/FAD-dependent oxidoreductase [Methanobacteriaceae archaeon]|nr:NAD(P)/FAD-dependent oxidoreductase [Methanobacteriaceae archaeon]
MQIYDIAVIGAGPAGCMAAIRGAQIGKKVILLEKNNKIGRKLLITGNGRCNFTNTAPLNVFLEMFGKRGSFYRDVFNKFSNHDLINFFELNGLGHKVEEDGRVFPITEKSKSVVDVLEKVLEEENVKILYNFCLKMIDTHENFFELYSTKNQIIKAYKVIMATGGASYRSTGSSGDGFIFANLLGHKITELKPGGVPLIVSEEWIQQLKGVTLKNVGMEIEYDNKHLTLTTRGNLLLTHFGISGPVILDMSHHIAEILDKYGNLKLKIDFIPEIKDDDLGLMLQADFQKYSKKTLKNYLKFHLPLRIIEPILSSLNLDPHKKLNQITKKERFILQNTLKSLPLTITGHLPLNDAFVTCGGVSKKEINPKTMESKLINRLYFAGEILSGCGRRGGYNLQQAFSTGYVAGDSASKN